MAKNKGDQGETPKNFLPQTTPQDLFPTSDIRFVMVEIGKLTTKVDRLISDVETQTTKVSGLQHQATALKTWIIAAGAFIALAGGFMTYIVTDKGNATLQAVRALGEQTSVTKITPQTPAGQTTPK